MDTYRARRIVEELAQESKLASKAACSPRVADNSRISMIRMRIENGFYDSDEVLKLVAGSIMQSLRAGGFAI